MIEYASSLSILHKILGLSYWSGALNNLDFSYNFTDPVVTFYFSTLWISLIGDMSYVEFHVRFLCGLVSSSKKQYGFLLVLVPVPVDLWSHPDPLVGKPDGGGLEWNPDLHFSGQLHCKLFLFLFFIFKYAPFCMITCMVIWVRDMGRRKHYLTPIFYLVSHACFPYHLSPLNSTAPRQPTELSTDVPSLGLSLCH